LTAVVGFDVLVNFTPHLMPMSRGILETRYVKLAPGKTVQDLKSHLENTYKDEPFVHVLEGAAVPSTRHVRGSNNCFINVMPDRMPGTAIIASFIDTHMYIYVDICICMYMGMHI
jgi:N-acetyl-gamma-glutamyl-phosphate reductase